MATQNIELTEHLEEFVTAEIDSGRYRDASEVLRAGLRLLEQQRQQDEQTLANLRQLAAEGFAEIDQGRGIALNSEAELDAYMDKLNAEAAENVLKRSQRAS